MVDDQVNFCNSIFVDLVMQEFGVVSLFMEDFNLNVDYGGCVELVVIQMVVFFVGFVDWMVVIDELSLEFFL